jgi:hypothetical protein
MTADRDPGIARILRAGRASPDQEKSKNLSQDLLDNRRTTINRCACARPPAQRGPYW